MERTRRLQHRIDLLRESALWQEMSGAERVGLWHRLHVAPALSALSDADRATLRAAAWQRSNDGDWGLIDEAADREDDDAFVDHALDSVGAPEGWKEFAREDEESAGATGSALGPEWLANPKPGDPLACPGRILDGVSPFTALRILEVHEDGALDIFVAQDLYPDDRDGQPSELPVWTGIPPSAIAFVEVDLGPWSMPPGTLDIPRVPPIADRPE